MSMKEFAENEVELVLKNERVYEFKEKGLDGALGNDADCYRSALKAFNTIFDDALCGQDIELTKDILCRLLDGKPLTPIEDTKDIWKDITHIDSTLYLQEQHETYQCKRMPSLFKHVYRDESMKFSSKSRVEYIDVDLFCCINIHDENDIYRLSLVSNVLYDMFPITMPYYPTKKFKVYCEEKCNYYTGVYYVITPDDVKIEINRFFYLNNEIDKTVYENRTKKC